MSRTDDQSGVDASRPIRELARWTLQTDPAWTDPKVFTQTKLLILDSIACAIAALDVSTPRRVADDACRARRQSEVLDHRRSATKSSILAAVLMNGALVRSLDFNDVQFFMKEGKLSVAGHCSDNIPVALAAAEYVGAPGSKIIEAVAMGYELFRPAAKSHALRLGMGRDQRFRSGCRRDLRQVGGARPRKAGQCARARRNTLRDAVGRALGQAFRRQEPCEFAGRAKWRARRVAGRAWRDRTAGGVRPSRRPSPGHRPRAWSRNPLGAGASGRPTS